MARSGATSNEYTSNISRTKSQNLNVSDLVLMLSLSNPLKPGVKSRMKMWLEHRRQAMLQIHLSDRLFYCLLRATYVRGLTVFFISVMNAFMNIYVYAFTLSDIAVGPLPEYR